METNDQDPLDLEGFQMILLGWTNPTPWNTFRELPENELAKRVDELVTKVTDPSRTIFNFHAPPYRSGLDEAPGLDENLNMEAGGRAMEPVGSTSVRTAIERVQPLSGLHGHISTKAGERYGSAGRWPSTRGAATKRAAAGRARHTRPKEPR